jgi:uncharacterized protein
MKRRDPIIGGTRSQPTWLEGPPEEHYALSEEETVLGGAGGGSLGDGLLSCAYNNDLNSVRTLVEMLSAPINFVDPRTGLTALHIAVGRDHLEIAKYLVASSALFLPDSQGRTPSTVAAECEVSDEMCDFIVEAEAKAEGV